jgi:hypothetical protein
MFQIVSQETIIRLLVEKGIFTKKIFKNGEGGESRNRENSLRKQKRR